MQRIKSLAQEAKRSTSTQNLSSHKESNASHKNDQPPEYLKAAYLGSLRPLNVADFEHALWKTSNSHTSVNEFNLNQWGDDATASMPWIKSALESLAKSKDSSSSSSINNNKNNSKHSNTDTSKANNSNTQENASGSSQNSANDNDDDDDASEDGSWRPNDQPLNLD